MLLITARKRRRNETERTKEAEKHRNDKNETLKTNSISNIYVQNKLRRNFKELKLSVIMEEEIEEAETQVRRRESEPGRKEQGASKAWVNEDHVRTNICR